MDSVVHKCFWIFEKIEEMCFLEQYNGFINVVLSTYSKSFIECNQQIALWLSEVQLDPWLVYLIFGRKYVYLSNDNLTVFIGWIVEQRDAFDTSGNDCLESKFKKYLVRAENKTTLSPSNLLPESISTPFPLPQTLDKTSVMETEETGNHLFTSEIEIVTCTNCGSGEFYLDKSEWDSIYISSNKRMSLTSN